MKCSKCGRAYKWEPRAGGREAGYCEKCDRRGPVIERDTAPAKPLDIPGLGPEITTVLVRLGYQTAEDICGKTDAQLIALPGLGEVRVGRIREWCEARK